MPRSEQRSPITKGAQMKPKLPRVKVEQVWALTWLFTVRATDSAYLLYMHKHGIYYNVNYAKLLTAVYGVPVTFPTAVFTEELFFTKVALQDSQVTPFAQELIAALMAGDVSNPQQLPYTFGGTFKHRSPVVYTPFRH